MTKRKTPYIRGLTIDGLTCFAETFVQGSVPKAFGMLRINFSAKNRHLRQAPTRVCQV